MKIKKIMAEAEMIDLFNESGILGVTASIPFLHDLPENFFESKVDAGELNSTVAAFEGTPAFRLIWNKTASHFHLLYLQKIGSGNIEIAFLAARKLARHLGCDKITLKTARKGMVADAQKFGGVVTGVFMEIKLA